MFRRYFNFELKIMSTLVNLKLERIFSISNSKKNKERRGTGFVFDNTGQENIEKQKGNRELNDS